MDIAVFPRHELDTVFRVLRTVLAPRETLLPREQSFLDTYARINLYEMPAGYPPLIGPQEVVIEGTHQRRRLIQLAGMAALLSNPVKPCSAMYLQMLSRHLATRDSVVDVVTALQEGKRNKARMITVARMFSALMADAYAIEGVRGVLRFFGALFLRTPGNQDKLWNYKRLGLLPEGTLGREYWRHLTQVGFSLPGEQGGIPETVAYHDVAHVLAEHDTTPLGEIQQGSFQGGNRRKDGFFFVLFAILQFHHGLQVTPAAPPQRGNFDPEKVLWAIHRGASVTVDLTHQWNFWPLMPLTLREARAKIKLLPKLPAKNAGV